MALSFLGGKRRSWGSDTSRRTDKTSGRGCSKKEETGGAKRVDQDGAFSKKALPRNEENLKERTNKVSWVQELPWGALFHLEGKDRNCKSFDKKKKARLLVARGVNRSCWRSTVRAGEHAAIRYEHHNVCAGGGKCLDNHETLGEGGGIELAARALFYSKD